MQFDYKTKGTCSQRIFFDIEDGKVMNVEFLGGCNGNLKGIGALVNGMDVDEVIQRVMERHRNDLYLNNQQIIEECMKELKLIKATT